MYADTDRHQDRPQTEASDKAAAAAPSRRSPHGARAFILCQCPEIEKPEIKRPKQRQDNCTFYLRFVSFRSPSHGRSLGSNQKQIRVNPQSTHVSCERRSENLSATLRNEL